MNEHDGLSLFSSSSIVKKNILDAEEGSGSPVVNHECDLDDSIQKGIITSRSDSGNDYCSRNVGIPSDVSENSSDSESASADDAPSNVFETFGEFCRNSNPDSDPLSQVSSGVGLSYEHAICEKLDTFVDEERSGLIPNSSATFNMGMHNLTKTSQDNVKMSYTDSVVYDTIITHSGKYKSTANNTPLEPKKPQVDYDDKGYIGKDETRSLSLEKTDTRTVNGLLIGKSNEYEDYSVPGRDSIESIDALLLPENPEILADSGESSLNQHSDSYTSESAESDNVRQRDVKEIVPADDGRDSEKSRDREDGYASKFIEYNSNPVLCKQNQDVDRVNEADGTSMSFSSHFAPSVTSLGIENSFVTAHEANPSESSTDSYPKFISSDGVQPISLQMKTHHPSSDSSIGHRGEAKGATGNNSEDSKPSNENLDNYGSSPSWGGTDKSITVDRDIISRLTNGSKSVDIKGLLQSTTGLLKTVMTSAPADSNEATTYVHPGAAMESEKPMRLNDEFSAELGSFTVGFDEVAALSNIPAFMKYCLSLNGMILSRITIDEFLTRAHVNRGESSWKIATRQLLHVIDNVSVSSFIIIYGLLKDTVFKHAVNMGLAYLFYFKLNSAHSILLSSYANTIQYYDVVISQVIPFISRNGHLTTEGRRSQFNRYLPDSYGAENQFSKLASCSQSLKTTALSHLMRKCNLITWYHYYLTITHVGSKPEKLPPVDTHAITLKDATNFVEELDRLLTHQPAGGGLDYSAIARLFKVDVDQVTRLKLNDIYNIKNSVLHSLMSGNLKVPTLDQSHVQLLQLSDETSDSQITEGFDAMFKIASSKPPATKSETITIREVPQSDLEFEPTYRIINQELRAKMEASCMLTALMKSTGEPLDTSRLRTALNKAQTLDADSLGGAYLEHSAFTIDIIEQRAKNVMKLNQVYALDSTANGDPMHNMWITTVGRIRQRTMKTRAIILENNALISARIELLRQKQEILHARYRVIAQIIEIYAGKKVIESCEQRAEDRGVYKIANSTYITIPRISHVRNAVSCIAEPQILKLMKTNPAQETRRNAAFVAMWRKILRNFS